jgi:cell division protease FtsH
MRIIRRRAPKEQDYAFGGRPRESDRVTRKPQSLWDRVKFLLLFVAVWFILVWSLMADDPIVGFSDAAKIQVRMGYWVFILAGIEAIRQIHYLISEHSRGYHQFWFNSVFGGVERTTHRTFSPWIRFRFWRLFRLIVVIVVIAIVAGKIIHTTPLLALLRMPHILWSALPSTIQIIFYLLFAVGQFALLFWFLSRGGVEVYYPDDIKTRFSDVWGQDQVLERVKENMVFLENPEIVEDRGGYVPGGILLWGPPGTGKTLMAEAVAGETGKPYVFVDPGAFTNMFIGVGILKVKSLFRKLRKLALRYGGVIVFFDEADSLGNRGAGVQGGALGQWTSGPFSMAGCNGFSYLTPDTQWLLARSAMSSAGEQTGPRQDKQIIGAGMNGGGGMGGMMGTLQALLSEMSGLKKPRGFINRVVRRGLGMRPKPPPKYRILIIMATNMPDSLDPALLRPGRIDRIYKIGYPTKAGRRRTYQGYFDKISHELTPEQIDKLAEITPYTTGAKIKDLVNEALILAIKDGRDVATWSDVTRAKLLKDAGPPEDVEYITRERHAVAVHEACHAVVAYLCRGDMPIERATIEKGADSLGLVASIPPEEQFTRWRSDYEADILSALASLAGERMFFDADSSSGVSGDLNSATTVASLMEGFWGMGSTVSSFAATRQLQVGAARGVQGRGQNAETEARTLLADRIEHNLSHLLDRAEEILRDNRGHVLAVAHALEMYKTITGDDVNAVMEHQRGPLVDGTVYADSAFMRELEEYHLAAARAHRDHDNEAQIPLPMPPQPVTAAVLADGYGALPNGSGGEFPGDGLLGTADRPRYQPPTYLPPGGTANGSPDGTANGTPDGTHNGSPEDPGEPQS